MRTINELKEMAKSGANLSVSAKGFTTLSLKELAQAGRVSGATLIINDAVSLTTLSCKEIASCHPGYVTFNF